MNILAIIPARGGSQRLRNKNIFPLWDSEDNNFSFFKKKIYVSFKYIKTKPKILRLITLIMTLLSRNYGVRWDVETVLK